MTTSNMKQYLVYFDHPTYGTHSYVFWAEDEPHAEEQLLDDVPLARNITTKEKKNVHNSRA